MRFWNEKGTVVMANKAFLFGAGSLAKVLLYYLRQEGREPEAFVVDDAYFRESVFCGLQVVPFSRAQDLLPPEEYNVYVAIGYGNMNTGRKNAITRMRSMGYKTPNYVHPSVLNASSAMGIGNLLFPGVVLDAYVEIGDGNILYPSVFVAHDCVIGDFNFFAPRVALAGDITVGNCCFFGLNCSVKNGLKIANDCLIGAGAYAAADLAEGTVLVPPRSVFLNADSKEIIKKVMKE